MRFQPKKLFYSIKEVSEMLDVEESLLRYWETQFPSIKPTRTRTKVRQYQEGDLKEIRMIYELVKVQGLTLAAAKRKIAKNRDKELKHGETAGLLRRVRSELLALKAELDGITPA
ncbi:MerR family transcriptional regulator [Candidatus Symbiothrix dinenymphae]|uniref:MerR family transcriptional regulator n=1 Tax=Candidatus Symbiothrix dinenymphae TaxID=467085 RepID=UPI0006E2ED43|nr:MerR family transcriptional regulator [Candidatus Symbiothrix dinenymphae]